MTNLAASATTVDAAPAEPDSCRVRWAGLSGREHGDAEAAPGFVLLHGLTFDRRMWDPVLDALPRERRAIAFDLPGHGGSAPLRRPGLDAAVEAIHEAVREAGLRAPILVGHSIAGPIATIYATRYPASGVVSIDAPLRFEPFAEGLRAAAPGLAGDGFDETWAGFREGLGTSLLADAQRSHLHERAFVAERLPHARVVVWPVGHHFPHVTEPRRFARLLTALAGTGRP